MDKRAKDLVAGDTTESYEVLSVRTEDGKVFADVKFNDGGTSTRVWDEGNTILTVKDKLFALEWGINSDRQVAIIWGARAIYNGPGTLDLLWDRQDMLGGTPDQRKEFSKFLNEYGIPAIKELTRDVHLSSTEDRKLTLSLHDWFIAINPRGSCGYLYIGVFPVDTGDPTFIPAAVPSPKPIKPKPVRKGARR